jgi:23S rRNA U2552 (ribose-2'-O)-methylase RlmE/FtsJ
MNEKYKIFKSGQTVVDLVCMIPLCLRITIQKLIEIRDLLRALGLRCVHYTSTGLFKLFSRFTKVAVNRTTPDGRVIGIDLIPAQPPRGVSTIQGNFLSPVVQAEVRAYVQDPELGRPRRQIASQDDQSKEGVTEQEMEQMGRGYIDLERQTTLEDVVEAEGIGHADTIKPDSQLSRETTKLPLKERDRRLGRVVDVVLSDMSEPWDQTTGFYKKSLSDPYFRMQNTSGIAFKDHVGSMVCISLISPMPSHPFHISNSKTGSMHGCTNVLFRYTSYRWAFHVQVLPRVGGQGFRDADEEIVY